MYSGNLAFQLSSLLHLSTIFQHHCEIRQQGKINIFQPRSMARPNSNVVCLSDSTGYGLLPDPKGFGAASLVDPETKCAISISCGGSLMKKGSAQKSTMELFLEFLSRGCGWGPPTTPRWWLAASQPGTVSPTATGRCWRSTGGVTTSGKQARRSWRYAATVTTRLGCISTSCLRLQQCAGSSHLHRKSFWRGSQMDASRW